MEATDFPGVNLRIAENQPEYETLPVHINREDPTTPTTMCFKLNQKELKQVTETGEIWLTMMTFGNNFHPIRMSCLKPAHLYMRVFKFFSEGQYYAFAGKDEQHAREALYELCGEIPITNVEEIPKEKWNEKTISVYEDNDTEKEPIKLSILECLEGDEPTMIFTNDPDYLS